MNEGYPVAFVSKKIQEKKNFNRYICTKTKYILCMLCRRPPK